jgi:hypothetical protein
MAKDPQSLKELQVQMTQLQAELVTRVEMQRLHDVQSTEMQSNRAASLDAACSKANG